MGEPNPERSVKCVPIPQLPLFLTPDDPIRMLAALWPLALQQLDPSPPLQNVNTISGREPMRLAQAGQMMDSDPVTQPPSHN